MTISRRNLLLTFPGAAIGGVAVGNIAVSADDVAREGNEKEIDENLQAAHKRLVGKWKSDVEKSMEFNDRFVKLTEQQRHFLRNFLGRMTIEYKARHITCAMPPFKFKKFDGELFEEKEGWDERNTYQLLGHDELEDRVSYRSKFAGFELISTIYLEGEHLWLYSAGFHIREYFTKID